jgi:hypothetical protein
MNWSATVWRFISSSTAAFAINSALLRRAGYLDLPTTAWARRPKSVSTPLATGGGATTAREYIRESIVSPDAYLVPGYEVTSHHMPAYGHLEEGEIQALVQLLLVQ